MDTSDTKRSWLQCLEKNYVVKVKYGKTLRLFTISKDKKFTFADLRTRILDLYKLRDTILTYTDYENEVVTITDDEDLKCAMLHLSLNPLKVTVVGRELTSEFPRFRGSRF